MKIWPFGTRKKEWGIALTRAVEEKIQIVFEPNLRCEASELIQKHCGFSLPLMQTIKPEDYDRIRFAVIKLSEGDLGVLREVIRQSHIDWRDALNGAGFAWDVEAYLKWDPKPTRAEQGGGADAESTV